MQQDLETVKSQIKENIQILIDNNKLEEANILIDEYFRMSNDDVEVYSMRAVVLIMKGQIDKAEEILLDALNYASYNFDLNYNLGYVYCNKKQYELGLQYYTKAYMATDDEEIKKNIKLIIKEMLSKLNLNEDVEAFLESKTVKNEDVNVQRCLVLCHFYSVYTKEFLEKIYNKTNIKFDILTIDSSYKEKVKSGIIENVYTYNDLNKMNKILNSNESYDIIHIHFLTPFYGEIVEQIRNKCKKLIITMWGSDFYRTTAEQKEQQRKLIDKADIITFDNDVTMDDFAKYYGIANKEKLSINRFGLTALEHIKELENIEPDQIKAEYNIPKNSIVVTCGYNANPAHNHLEIIKSIKQIKNRLPQNMYYIFPMTYSRDEKYCDIVKRELAQSGLKYIVLEEFMNFEQMAKLTKITDIMVQLQTTDTLSATMQEHMYHGNIIITGSWLPYKPLKQVGAYFLEVSSVNKIGKKLIDVVQDLTIMKQRCKKNKNIIWNFSAWENTAGSWIEVYNKKVDVQLLEFNHAVYWDYRYGNKFDLESSGTMGLGITYNKYLYKSRLDVLDYLNKHILGSISNKKVLELGTGTGYFTNYFNEQNIKIYYGIDISQKSINNLSSIYKDFKFKCGDISDRAVYEHNKTYNLIFASDVLLHLTNDEKFQKSIHNIASVLDDNGYFIDIEPITMMGVETSSPHNRIIKYEEFKVALEKENLEIVDTIPVTFFMDYPFDYKLMGSIGEKALNAFNEVTAYLQDDSYTLEEREKMAEKIYYFDKLFLKSYGKGLSNKLIIVKKKGNSKNHKVLIENIWTNDEVSCSGDFEKFNINNLNENKICNLEYEKPLVTVGIASYNNVKYFDKCIESVISQDYSNLEILIVDDCSNDGVKDRIIYYEKKYKNIKVIFHEKNSGSAGLAFQEIISKANGEYFALLCSDDYLYSNNTIKAFLNEFLKNPMLDFAFGKFYVINSDNIKIGEWKYKNYTNDEIIYGTFRNFGSARVPMNGGIFKTSFYRDQGRTWYTDNELKDTSDGFNTLVNTKYGWRIKYIDEYFIGYRQHEDNMTYDLKNRIFAVIPNMEYVVKNFSEEIYFPEINWKDYINGEKQAVKMYLIGYYYYQMFLYYYNENWKAFGEYEIEIKKDELVEKLEPIVKLIFKYFYMSLRVSDMYSIQISKIEDNLKQIGYKVYNRSEHGEN